MGRLGAMVYIANLAGSAIFAAHARWIGTALRVIEQRVLSAIARDVVDHPWWLIMLSGVRAGWLMGLLARLVTAARDTISQIAIVWLITYCIGLAHLHHSLVGSTELLAGVFGGHGVTLGEYGATLLWSTLGNAIGGVIIVAIIKYSHVMQSGGAHEKSAE